MRAHLTPTDFRARLDNVYLTARANVLKDGYAAEVLILMDPKGRERPILNQGPPYAKRPDDVRELVRLWHAVAAIHVSEAWLGWISGDASIDAMAPAERPDREDVLIVAAAWPIMGVSELRCASIVRSGESTDLVDLDVTGRREAAGLPPAGKLEATSWLAELLPRH